MTFHNNAIFWIDVGKIQPNPYQPRREFDQGKLQDLSDSIRQYGVLQPLVVTRNEVFQKDGGMVVEYELIAGERRLRAARLAGVMQVPSVIRDADEGDNVKLELAIIENLQREDLNPVDRAMAFSKLVNEFGYKHVEVAKKVGRSREYVSNTVRLLQLPETMIRALAEGKIMEGHTRPLLMLTTRPEEQETLFKEIIFKKLTVRDSEHISRRIASDRVRKNDKEFNPEIVEMEQKASERLGTRVRIAPKPKDPGGKILIEFDSDEDLRALIARLAEEVLDENTVPAGLVEDKSENVDSVSNQEEQTDDDIYSISNFSV